MKKLSFLFFLLMPFSASAQVISSTTVKMIYNPISGYQDFITVLSTNSIQAGTNVAVVATSSGVSISASGGGGGSPTPGSTSYIQNTLTPTTTTQDFTVRTASFTGILSALGGGTIINGSAANPIPLTIRGNSGLDLQRWRSAFGNQVLAVNNSGDISPRNVSYTWPSSDVTAGFFYNDGLGNISFQTPGGSGLPGGPANSIQYSDGVNFAGSSQFTFTPGGAAEVALTSVDANYPLLTLTMAAMPLSEPLKIMDVSSTEIFGVSTAGDVHPRNVSYSWPSSNSSGILTNDGSGNLSWGSVTSPGGSSGDIQYNNSGVFAGVAQVPTSKGGTGLDSSGSTGLAYVASGNWTFNTDIQFSGSNVGVGVNPSFLLDVNGMVNTPGTSGNTYRWGSSVGAPTTGVAVSLPLTYIGNNNDTLTDPAAWALISINGTEYKIPAY